MFTDDTIVNLENSKESTTTTKILLELIIDYNKMAWSKVNIQKSSTFLCTGNKQLKFEVKDALPFITAASKMKYLVINLTKYIYKIYIREQIKEVKIGDIFHIHG